MINKKEYIIVYSFISVKKRLPRAKGEFQQMAAMKAKYNTPL
jgi:hypothetical protein